MIFYIIFSSLHLPSKIGNKILTQSILLANGCVACEHVCILRQCDMRGHVRPNVDHTTPLGEVTAARLVLGTAFVQSVKT
jgi:hypothetical protein